MEFKAQIIPSKLTTAERDALPVVVGGVIYNTTVNRLQCYNGSVWLNMGSVGVANFPPDFLYQTIKIVQTLADFPAPVGNEIILEDEIIYFIDNPKLDILQYTIVFSQRNQINGFGQNVSGITSTVGGTAMAKKVNFKSGKNLFMNDLELFFEANHQRMFQNIGDGTVLEGESFELNRLNILNEQAPGHGCELGYIKNIRQGFVGTVSVFNVENGFKFGGTWTGGFRVDNTIFIDCSGKFFYSDPLFPVTFARRFASNANITVPVGSIGYDFPSTAFTESGQYQLQNGNATGLGTYVSNFASGFPAYDPIGNFQNNTGIQNTFPGGEWVVTANTTIVVAAQNVYYDFVVPTTEKGLAWFNETTGQFEYLSNTPLDVQILLTVTLTGTANNLIEVQLIKESAAMVITPLLSRIVTLQGTLAQGRAESAVITTTAQLVFGDKVRVRARNTSAAQNFTISLDTNCIINAK